MGNRCKDTEISLTLGVNLPATIGVKIPVKFVKQLDIPIISAAYLKIINEMEVLDRVY